MRSIYFHLRNTTHEFVARALDTKYRESNPNVTQEWVHIVNGDSHLWIYFNDELESDLLREFESKKDHAFIHVNVDVSSQHESWPTTQEFAIWILSEFEGFAEDDAGDHLWTLDEIRNDMVVNGKQFGLWRNPNTPSATGSRIEESEVDFPTVFAAVKHRLNHAAPSSESIDSVKTKSWSIANFLARTLLGITNQLGFVREELAGHPKMPVRHQSSVIVSFRYDNIDLAPLYELEEQLVHVIKQSGLGEFDGHEIAIDGSVGRLYMYGPDADALFALVRPMIESSNQIQDVKAILTYGPPSGNPKRVEVSLKFKN